MIKLTAIIISLKWRTHLSYNYEKKNYITYLFTFEVLYVKSKKGGTRHNSPSPKYVTACGI